MDASNCVHRGASSTVPSQISSNSWGMGSYSSDVCDVVSFFERWDCIEMQDDAGDGSVGFEYELAKIVGNKTDFHALLHIRTALHKRVPDARAVGQNVHDFVEPDGVRDAPGFAWKHFENAHGVECPVDEECDIICFDDARIASFDDDRRLAPSSRRVVEVASGA